VQGPNYSKENGIFELMLKFSATAIIIAALSMNVAYAQADQGDSTVKSIIAQNNKDPQHTKVIVLPPVKMDFLNNAPNLMNSQSTEMGDSPIGIHTPTIKPVVIPKKTSDHQPEALKDRLTQNKAPISLLPSMPPLEGIHQPNTPTSQSFMAPTGTIKTTPLPPSPLENDDSCLNHGASTLTAGCLASLGIPLNGGFQALPPVSNTVNNSAPVSHQTQVNDKITCIVTLPQSAPMTIYTKDIKSCVSGALVIANSINGVFTVMIDDEYGNTSGVQCSSSKDHNKSCHVMNETN
jgi:hypothetical protein